MKPKIRWRFVPPNLDYELMQDMAAVGAFFGALFATMGLPFLLVDVCRFVWGGEDGMIEVNFAQIVGSFIGSFIGVFIVAWWFADRRDC